MQIFEEEALTWDEKLNRLRTLLDSWVEVQRKWLYLEGVFSGSQDIQMLLPAEHQRFRGIDAGFQGIIKKADTTKVVLEVRFAYSANVGLLRLVYMNLLASGMYLMRSSSLRGHC